MSGNLEPERGACQGGGGSGGSAANLSSGAGKIYPMDLAVTPQKITIVKSTAAPGDSKLHQAATQSKPHLLPHSGPISLVRPSPQIISQGVAAQQPQMIVSSGQLLPGAQMMNQSSQIINSPQMISQSGQIINPPQIISQGTQLINQGAQIISQGSQLMSQAGQAGGAQVLSVGTSLIGAGGVMVSTGTPLRSLPPSMRLLPPATHSSPRPASSVTVTPIGVLNNKPTLVGVSSHVPRGPAAGASLAAPRAAARPAVPASTSLPLSTLSGWSGRPGVRGAALVYPARTPQRGPSPRSTSTIGVPTSHSVHSQTPISTNAVTTTAVANAGSGALSPVQRMTVSRAGPQQRATGPLLQTRAPLLGTRVSTPLAVAPRQLPVLQRNFQPAKVVTVGTRAPIPTPAPVHRSALYYEVTRTTAPTASLPSSYTHNAFLQHNLPAVSMTVVPVTTCVESRLAPTTSPAPTPPPANPLVASALARPSILRKRDVEVSPSKSVGTSTAAYASLSNESNVVSVGWSVRRTDALPEEDARMEEEEGGEGGSTTVSAASSPAPDDEPLSPPRAATPPAHPPHDISPRKKPRKQMLSSEVRLCELQNEEPPPSPPAVLAPPPRRSMLGPGWVCGYRSTALHFNRPSEVRRREAKPPHVLELANEKHVLTKANGWKVHHLTAQMDDLVELESASHDHLSSVLRTLDTSGAPDLHNIKELVKGNMQRSKIICEDMRETRADILRVFTHRTLVADILARQADKRCFRKHRTHS